MKSAGKSISRIGGFALLAIAWLIALSTACAASSPRPCVSIEQAGEALNKDICISAHIYDVVQLGDGTRFLDVCAPEVPDRQCRFTVISLQADRREVGELKKLQGTDVHIRGVVQPVQGRMGMLLSHSRQLRGGPPKFRPNPRLATGFDVEDSRPAVNDPNLRRQGGRRGFMNSRDQEPAPSK